MANEVRVTYASPDGRMITFDFPAGTTGDVVEAAIAEWIAANPPAP